MRAPADLSPGLTRGLPAASRLLRQPGPVARERITLGRDARAAVRSNLVRLAPGAPLVEAFVAAMRAATGGEWRPAAFELLSGALEPCIYCLAAPDTGGARVVTYTPMRNAGTVRLFGGAATLGIGADGAPLLHCHAWFAEPHEGRVFGGHLDTAASRIGGEGVRVRMTVFDGFDIRQLPDAETNHTLFRPLDRSGGGQ